MSDYALLLASVWMASGVIPAIIYERWMMRRYCVRPDEWSAIRLFIAFLAGPMAFAGIAIVMNALDEDDDD